jgi:hypothetical protein
MRRRRWATPSIVGLAIASSSATARSQPAAPVAVEPIVVEYTAPQPPCPSAASFVAQIEQRTTRARLAAPGENARRFFVRLEQRTQGFGGGLVLASDGSSREVIGTSCDEVASALALIVALAIDPQASTAPVPTPVPLPGPPSSAPPVVPFAPIGPPTPRWTDPWPAQPPPRVDRGPGPWPPLAQPLPAVPQDAGSRNWTGALGAGGGALSGFAPGASLLIGIHGELRLERPGLLAPAFRLGARFAPSNQEDTAIGTATFRLFAGEVSACPIRLEADRFRLFPCAGLELGGLVVEASSERGPQTSVRPWMAAGLAARGQLALVEPLRLEAQLGAAVPFVQDEFVFEPDETVHATPPLSGSGLVGVVVDIW